MKQLKVILISVEIATLICIISLAFTEVSEEAAFFKSMFLSILPVFAVVMQKEQQSIEWDEEDEIHV
jgi:hypothetical protein